MRDAWSQYEKQKGKCAITGLNIDFSYGRPENEKKGFASIDRISSDLGYTVENIQWVHAYVNWMKLDYPQDYFINWCRKVSSHGRHPGSLLATRFETNKHGNFKGEGQLGSQFFKSCIRHAKDRKIRFDLTIKQAWEAFIQQGGRCTLSGVQLDFKRYRHPGNASIDRINSKMWYSESNIQFVHKHLNRMKWDLDNSEFIEWCHKVRDYSLRES